MVDQILASRPSQCSGIRPGSGYLAEAPAAGALLFPWQPAANQVCQACCWGDQPASSHCLIFLATEISFSCTCPLPIQPEVLPGALPFPFPGLRPWTLTIQTLGCIYRLTFSGSGIYSGYDLFTHIHTHTHTPPCHPFYKFTEAYLDIS